MEAPSQSIKNMPKVVTKSSHFVTLQKSPNFASLQHYFDTYNPLGRMKVSSSTKWKIEIDQVLPFLEILR